MIRIYMASQIRLGIHLSLSQRDMNGEKEGKLRFASVSMRIYKHTHAHIHLDCRDKLTKAIQT